MGPVHPGQGVVVVRGERNPVLVRQAGELGEGGAGVELAGAPACEHRVEVGFAGGGVVGAPVLFPLELALPWGVVHIGQQ